MRIPLFLLALTSAFTVSPAARAETCNYDIDANSLQINWTAFKTSQKVGVNGNFSEVTLEGDLQGKDLPKLLNQLEAEVDVTAADKLRTGNPARDNTIYQHFFSQFKQKAKLKGTIHGVKLKGDTSQSGGTFDLKLSMNNKTQNVPMQFTLNPEGAFSATGSINVLDFGLSGALADLHKACEALHTGADGVSKTWPNVDLKLVATIHRSCK